MNVTTPDDAGRGDRRTRMLVVAVAGSYVSKAGSLVMTLFGLPLAVRALTDAEFATLAAYWLIVAWTGFFNPLIGPALGVAIAGNMTKSDGPIEARRFARAAVHVGMVAALAVSIVAGLVAAFFLNLSSASSLLVAVAISLMTHFVAIGDGFRTGFHRAHLNGVWAGVGALAGFALICLAVAVDGPALAFTIGIFVLPLAIRALAFGIEHHRARVDRSVPIVVPWLRLARRNAYHIATVQLGTVLGFPLAMFIMIRLHPEQAGSLFVTQSIGLATLGLVAGAFEPLGTAAADAMGRDDLEWVRSVVRTLSLACLAASVVGVVAASTIGRPIAVALYDSVAPGRWTLVLIALSVGLVAAFGFSYQILLGLGLALESARAVLPGYALGAVATMVGASGANVPMVVLGAMLIPAAVGLARLSRNLRRAIA